ncbi:hypothetical protein, partial [Anaplasma phagocytophilum]|uniref:hypothetical protein n=1 Tax=Anaplasma phagocytophilum TaxID=948 RepID=UPI00201AB33F
KQYPQTPDSAIEDHSIYLIHLGNVLQSITQTSCLITQQALLEESQPMGASWEKFDEAHSELFNALWYTVTIYRGENRTIIQRNHELNKVPSIIVTMIVTMQHYRHHTPRSVLFPMALDSSATIRENETIERCAAAMRIFYDAVHLIPKYTLHATYSPPRALIYRNLLSETEQTSRIVSLVNRHTPLRQRSCVRNCLKEQFSLLMLTIELIAKHLDVVQTFCYIPISRAKDIVLSEAEAFANNACLDRVSEYREDVDTADLSKAITKTINAIYIVHKIGDVINVTTNWDVWGVSCLYGLGIEEVSLVHCLIEKTFNVSRRTMKGMYDITASVKVLQASLCEVGGVSALRETPEMLRDVEYTRDASVSHKLDAISISAEKNEQIPIATLRYETLTYRLRTLVSRLPISYDTCESDSCLLMRFMVSILFASGDIEGLNVLKDGAGVPRAFSNLITTLAENDLAPTYSRC